MGSALPLIQLVTFCITVLCVALTLVSGIVNGVLVLGTVFLVACIIATRRMGKQR